jgi:hypothetical protein
MTVRDLIKSSLKLIGVIAIDDDVHASDANEALMVLNMMLDQWNNEKLLTYYELNELFPLSVGVYSYAIGAGQTFNTTRPIKIDQAFIRDTNSTSNIDQQLELVPNDKYQAITLKTMTSNYPMYLNYLASYPYGEIKIWPVPSITGLYLNISQRKQLTRFASLDAIVTLPPGYEMALRYNLAMELAPEYGSPASQMIAGKASVSKAQLKTVNQEFVLMTCDAPLVSSGRYNILTDQ